MSIDTITAIKKALEGVTPGPWVTYEGSLGYKGDVFAPTSKFVKDCHHIARCFAPRPEQSPLCDLQAIKVVDDAVAAVEANTIYIAAVNPAAITELLSILESLQRENSALKIDASYHAADAETVRLEREVERRRAEAAEAEVKRLQTELALSKPLFSRRQIEARVKLLEEALKPFAEYKTADGYNGTDFLRIKDEHPILFRGLGSSEPALTVGDFRRARTALASTGGEHHAE